MKKLKQILSNKNTVTFIAAILIVLVLYVFYNWRVNQATSPIRVPYANQTINPRTKITNDMISYLEIPSTALKGNVITNVNNIVGMYTNVNGSIPAGSVFYKSQVVKQEELPEEDEDLEEDNFDDLDEELAEDNLENDNDSYEE